jgi:hypothetical protein
MLTEGEMLQFHICIRSSQVKITLRDDTLKRLLKCRTGGVRYSISKLSGKKTGDSGAVYYAISVLLFFKKYIQGVLKWTN